MSPTEPTTDRTNSAPLESRVLTRMEARLDRVERDAHRWRVSARRFRTGLFGLLIVNAAAVGVATIAVPNAADVLQAERFEVVDDTGNLVLALSADERGGQINLWTKEGQNIFRMSTNDVGGDLNLWTRDGGTIFSAFAGANGGELGLWDADGQRTMHVTSDADGGKLELLDDEGRPAFAAHVNGTGGVLELSSTAGAEPVFKAHCDATGAAALMLGNAAGRPLMTVESSEVFGSSLLLSDTQGRPRVMMRTEERGGALSFANEMGKQTLTLGVSGPTGGGFVDVANADGTRIIAAGADDDGCGRVDVSIDSGQRVFSIDAVPDVGASLGLFSSRGKKAMMFATRPEGGLINLFNQHEVPVFVASYAEKNLGGALSIKNGRGLPVVHLNSDDLGHGRLTVYDVEGKRRRVVQTPR